MFGFHRTGPLRLGIWKSAFFDMRRSLHVFAMVMIGARRSQNPVSRPLARRFFSRG